jgi:hypothetical protein
VYVLPRGKLVLYRLPQFHTDEAYYEEYKYKFLHDGLFVTTENLAHINAKSVTLVANYLVYYIDRVDHFATYDVALSFFALYIYHSVTRKSYFAQALLDVFKRVSIEFIERNEATAVQAKDLS